MSILMTFSLSKRDQELVSKFNTHSSLGRLVAESDRLRTSFGVGDVLIRHKKYDGGGKSTYDTLDVISTTCAVPKKFKVVYKDEYGMPWVKQVSVSGGLGSKLISVLEMSANGLYRYSLDPEQIESILLGFRYDPRREYKEMRSNNPEYGRKDAEDDAE